MKKKLTFLLLFLTIITAKSQTFTDGTFSYTVTDVANSYVSITKDGSLCPTGDLIIPETASNEGVTYTVTTIQNMAFFNCGGIVSLTIPNTVTDIGDLAFQNCTGLTGDLTLPESITSIGDYAFVNCSGLTGDLIFPELISSIGRDTFTGCSGLTGLIIPDSVTSIGVSAFNRCTGLTYIIIPASVTSIGSSAFYNCNSIESITVNWELPGDIVAIEPSVFDLVPIETIPLNVPGGTESNYLAVPVWQDFIIEEILNTTDINKAITLQVYPNPVSDILTIKLSPGYTLETLNIYNSLGKLVKQS